MSQLEIEIRREGGDVRCSAGSADDRVEFSFSSPAAELEASPDAALALGLMPAMRAGRSLAVPGGVSPRLLENLPDLQRTLACFGDFWGEPLAPVEVRATQAPPRPQAAGRGVGCFFSGGLDSFYSVLRQRDRLSHLIFVHGFDIPLEAHELREQAAGAARTVARELGLTLIEIETDVRRFLGRDASWDYVYGAGLASVALLLQHELRRVLVPASDFLHWVIPWGSHPALDPLYGTEALDLVHDGGDTDRVGKAALVGESDLAMGLLRVCWLNPGGAYNCGRCEKCVRTMVELRVAGHGDRCRTLPALDLGAVAARSDFYATFRRSQIAAARTRGDDELVAALMASGTRVGDDPDALKAEIVRLRRALDAVEESRSFRLLAPLRALRRRARRDRLTAI